MAQLRDTLIQGSARVTDTLYANTIQGNLLKTDDLQSPLISLYTTINNGANTSQGINLYANNTLKGHIGISDLIGIYGAGKIVLRPGGGSIATDRGIEITTTTVTPYSTAGTSSAVSLGTADYRWNGIYSSTGNFSSTITATGITNKGDMLLYTTSNDSPDIVWYYANGSKEKSRIWTADTYTTAAGPYYRCYDSSGTQLYSGNLMMGSTADNTNDLYIATIKSDDLTRVRYTSGVGVKAGAMSLTSITASSNISVKGQFQTLNSANNAMGQIYCSGTDAANGYKEALNNLVLSSWYGVSFTTQCASQGCTGVNAVSINCRTGELYARSVYAGTSTSPEGEYRIQVTSGAGKIYMYSTQATNGNRGIFGANASGSTIDILSLDQNNAIIAMAPFNLSCAIEKSGNNTSWVNARDGAIIRRYRNFQGETTASLVSSGNYNIANGRYVAAVSLIGLYYTWSIAQYTNDTLYFDCTNNDHYNSATNQTVASISMTTSGALTANQVYGAVWNDYAEYRKQLYKVEPGRVVYDLDDGYILPTDKRLQPGAQVVSDTFGFAIGETEESKTPLAVTGRVLVYTYRDRYEYHAGDAVCSAPNGTVDIMTREEIKEYPDAIIGIVSEIPRYETWGTSNVPINGRIWIKVR